MNVGDFERNDWLTMSTSEIVDTLLNNFYTSYKRRDGIALNEVFIQDIKDQFIKNDISSLQDRTFLKTFLHDTVRKEPIIHSSNSALHRLKTSFCYAVMIVHIYVQKKQTNSLNCTFVFYDEFLFEKNDFVGLVDIEINELFKFKNMIILIKALLPTDTIENNIHVLMDLVPRLTTNKPKTGNSCDKFSLAGHMKGVVDSVFNRIEKSQNTRKRKLCVLSDMIEKNQNAQKKTLCMLPDIFDMLDIFDKFYTFDCDESLDDNLFFSIMDPVNTEVRECLCVDDKNYDYNLLTSLDDDCQLIVN